MTSIALIGHIGIPLTEVLMSWAQATLIADKLYDIHQEGYEHSMLPQAACISLELSRADSVLCLPYELLLAVSSSGSTFLSLRKSRASAGE